MMIFHSKVLVSIFSWKIRRSAGQTDSQPVCNFFGYQRVSSFLKFAKWKMLYEFLMKGKWQYRLSSFHKKYVLIQSYINLFTKVSYWHSYLESRAVLTFSILASFHILNCWKSLFCENRPITIPFQLISKLLLNVLILR